jgi:peptidylprolyl isomerase domain and WD repeat-containing protein 1
MLYMERFDFERRFTVEKEIEKHWSEKEIAHYTGLHLPSVEFDETGTYIYFGTLFGIKVINVRSNNLVRVLGKVENSERFMRVKLY